MTTNNALSDDFYTPEPLDLALFEHTGDTRTTPVVVRSQHTLDAMTNRRNDLAKRLQRAEAAGRGEGMRRYLKARIANADQHITILSAGHVEVPRKEGWSGYPGILGPMTDVQYARALEEARLWLGPELSGDEEPWRVWNRLNARFEGGIETFIEGTRHAWM